MRGYGSFLEQPNEFYFVIVLPGARQYIDQGMVIRLTKIRVRYETHNNNMVYTYFVDPVQHFVV